MVLVEQPAAGMLVVLRSLVAAVALPVAGKLLPWSTETAVLADNHVRPNLTVLLLHSPVAEPH